MSSIGASADSAGPFRSQILPSSDQPQDPGHIFSPLLTGGSHVSTCKKAKLRLGVTLCLTMYRFRRSKQCGVSECSEPVRCSLYTCFRTLQCCACALHVGRSGSTAKSCSLASSLVASRLLCLEDGPPFVVRHEAYRQTHKPVSSGRTLSTEHARAFSIRSVAEFMCASLMVGHTIALKPCV